MEFGILIGVCASYKQTILSALPISSDCQPEAIHFFLFFGYIFGYFITVELLLNITVGTRTYNQIDGQQKLHI